MQFYDNKIFRKKVVKFLIGNKSESGRREIAFEAGQDFARKNDFKMFLEVSAKCGTNVNQTFQLLAENLLENKKSFCKKVISEDSISENENEEESQTLFSSRERHREIRFVKNLSCCWIL